MSDITLDVSIVIPVFNKLAFTRQCLDRLWRNTPETLRYEVIVVDNGSTDGTEAYLREAAAGQGRLRYHRNATNLGFAGGNNVGAALAAGRLLLFLNNDTLVQPGWLEAMVGLANSDPRIGIVGIKQLFPYTNTVHHAGMVFTADGRPQHLYPHADGDLPHVNKQREYQVINGACLLIGRELFESCGRFDEGYRNGYEDVDLCLTVRQRGFKIMCCTTAFIYHYGQITEGRTAADDANAARLRAKWGGRFKADESDYYRQDVADIERARRPPRPERHPQTDPAGLYFVDDLSSGSALTWAIADLALALHRRGQPVYLREGPLTESVPEPDRGMLRRLMTPRAHPDGVHLKWSHYWPQHLSADLLGKINLEFFVINYFFGAPQRQPWDYWLQCLRQNHYHKLPLTRFCRDVLLQVGVPEGETDVFPLGYSPEILEVGPRPRRSRRFRLLTVTNSHDLERYGTWRLLESYWQAFGPQDDVVLVVKDYGAASNDTTLRQAIHSARGRAAVEYVDAFTSKRELIELYRSCDAFVSAHRSEGFGMKILDAMACGLPVITPLFGGPADYCTPENAFAVDFTHVPMGDCLDRRALRITNEPMWCEPSDASLVKQLRFVFENPGVARAVGEQGRRDVVDRFTWDAAALRLMGIVERLRADQPGPSRRTSVAPAATPPETSPYWLGCRVSVTIPTFNRKTLLLKCLDALARQSILPQEFEVIVVDDGSTDGTEAALSGQTYPFRLRYYRQANQGPGAARNFALSQAEGELVLYIGDDIIADSRLLEHHLLAHAQHSAPGTAILGLVDWPPWLPTTPVMDYVSGEGGQQFAYRYIPHLPALDYRFFYTSNISVKRQFLVEADAAGVRFDPCFRYAAFEDSEFAWRLQARGLEVHYCPEAVAYHEHLMDLESFARREHNVGEMAVVFYRKHPAIDDLLNVRIAGEYAEAVETLLAQPALLEKVKDLDAETDRFFYTLERSLEGLPVRGLLHDLLGVIFDVQRARGKVREWFAGVEDPRRIEAAQALLGCLRKFEFFAAASEEIRSIGPGLPWLDPDAMAFLATRVGDVQRQFRPPVTGPAPLPAPGPAFPSLLRRVVLRGRLLATLKTADTRLQNRLRGAADLRWLARYQRLRGRLKRVL